MTMRMTYLMLLSRDNRDRHINPTHTQHKGDISLATKHIVYTVGTHHIRLQKHIHHITAADIVIKVGTFICSFIEGEFECHILPCQLLIDG